MSILKRMMSIKKNCEDCLNKIKNKENIDVCLLSPNKNYTGYETTKHVRTEGKCGENAKLYTPFQISNPDYITLKSPKAIYRV